MSTSNISGPSCLTCRDNDRPRVPAEFLAPQQGSKASRYRYVPLCWGCMEGWFSDANARPIYRLVEVNEPWMYEVESLCERPLQADNEARKASCFDAIVRVMYGPHFQDPGDEYTWPANLGSYLDHIVRHRGMLPRHQVAYEQRVMPNPELFSTRRCADKLTKLLMQERGPEGKFTETLAQIFDEIEALDPGQAAAVAAMIHYELPPPEAAHFMRGLGDRADEQAAHKADAIIKERSRTQPEPAPQTGAQDGYDEQAAYVVVLRRERGDTPKLVKIPADRIHHSPADAANEYVELGSGLQSAHEVREIIVRFSDKGKEHWDTFAADVEAVLARHRPTPAPGSSLHAWTDYPLKQLGDKPHLPAPIREVLVLGWDGNKYCSVQVPGLQEPVEIKSGCLYTRAGRSGEVPTINTATLKRS